MTSLVKLGRYCPKSRSHIMLRYLPVKTTEATKRYLINRDTATTASIQSYQQIAVTTKVKVHP